MIGHDKWAWLRTWSRHLWHVQVIYKDQKSLPHGWAVDLFGPLLHTGLQIPLQVH